MRKPACIVCSSVDMHVQLSGCACAAMPSCAPHALRRCQRHVAAELAVSATADCFPNKLQGCVP